MRATWEAGHAELFAAEAAQQGFDAVIAGGGDGTVNAVAAGLCANGAAPQTAFLRQRWNAIRERARTAPDLSNAIAQRYAKPIPTRDVPTLTPYLIALALLAIPPIFFVIRAWGMESARWKESDYAPESDDDSSDSDDD